MPAFTLKQKVRTPNIVSPVCITVLSAARGACVERSNAVILTLQRRRLTALYLKIQSVPRSKHCPSRL
jgi:hypothetical protein